MERIAHAISKLKLNNNGETSKVVVGLMVIMFSSIGYTTFADHGVPVLKENVKVNAERIRENNTENVKRFEENKNEIKGLDEKMDRALLALGRIEAIMK